MGRLVFTGTMLLVAAGCSARQVTNTPRSALEQLLLSGAVDTALEGLQLPEVSGKKLHVDFTNLKAYDVEYVRLAARVRFAQLGAVLVEKPEEADLIAEVASGGLGTEFKSSMVGMPSLPVPNSAVATPEMPAYRGGEQTGIVKLLIFLHRNGKLIAARHCYAKCDRDESFMLWWRFQRQDDVREGWEEADQAGEAGQTRPSE